MHRSRHGNRPAVGVWLTIFACVACLGVLFVSPSSGRAEETPCAPAPIGGEAGAGNGVTKTFEYNEGAPMTVRIPAGVDEVTIEAQGGHGGSGHAVGAGGAAGGVQATVRGLAGKCLEVWVGGYGVHDGGQGWAQGGRGGDHANGTGKDGGGGGGASAVIAPGGVPIVVAGGTVQFRLDGQPLGLPVPVAGGKAEIRAGPDLRIGTRRVTADFPGDGSYAPSHAKGDQTVEASKPGGGAAANPPAPFAQLPPAGTARVLGHRIRTTHEGTALVKVRCLGASGARCAGRLRLLAAEARPGLGVARDERLGGARYRLRSGTTEEVAVRLTGAARDVLVRFGRLRVRADLGTVGDGAAPRTLELVAVHSPPVIVDNSRVTVFADGHLRLRLYCDTERALRCRAGLTIKDDFERTLAARELRLTGDRHRTVTLRSPQLRRLAERGVEVRAIAATVSTSPAGIETVRHRRLALLPAGDRNGRRGLARRLRLPAASPSAPRTLPR